MAAAKGNTYSKKAVTRPSTLGGVRANEADKARWTQAATLCGCTLSVYVRRVLDWSVEVMADDNGLEHAIRRISSRQRREFRHRAMGDHSTIR
jgi:hypothetical protein